MLIRLTTFACILLLACTATAQPFQQAWNIQGAGGFSAANAVRSPGPAGTWRIVVCERDLGVVCLSAAGERLWEFPLTPPVTASPGVADVNGDGREDIVAADSTGRVVALDADGNLLWSAEATGPVIADSCPSIVDLDRDGSVEVLVGDAGGTLSCFDATGAFRWSFTGDGTKMGPVLTADLYERSGVEIVVTSHDRHVYALGADGTWLWDVYRADDLFPNSTPILADADGDGLPEIYVGGGLHHFYRIDPNTGTVSLEENVYLHVNAAIGAADLDADGRDEVVFGNKGGGTWCYDRSGERWSHDFHTSSQYAGPVFADLDSDKLPEVLLFSATGQLHALDAGGQPLWSEATGVKVIATPLLGDVDGDGRLDAVVSSQGGVHGNNALALIAFDAKFDRADGSFAAVFAGDRAHTGCRAPGRAFGKTETPEVRGDTLGKAAYVQDSDRILSGTNRWRYDVTNPDAARLALIARIECPSGEVLHHCRHIHAARDRTQMAFAARQPGPYTARTRLVDLDSRVSSRETEQRIAFAGSDTDRAYLTERFAAITETLDAWRTANPRAAEAMARNLKALKGRLRAPSDQGPSTQKLESLRTEADRLLTLCRAGALRAPSGTFLAYAYNPWAYFHPRETLPTKDSSSDLEVALCVGECESLAVNVTSLLDRTLDVRVRCDAPQKAIAFHRSVLVPTLRRNTVADALPSLDQGDLLTVPPHEAQQLWITVDGSRLKPGDYTATIRLVSVEPDPTVVEVPMRIRVHDLALPRPRPLRFCLWSMDGGALGAEKPEVLRDLVDHGTTVFFGQSPRAQCDDTGKLVGPVDFAAHDETVKRLAPHGMVLFIGSQGSVTGQPFLSDPWKRAFVDYLRRWVAHMDELGLDYHDWALYPYDEPSTPYTATTRNLVEVAKIIREADPRILIYTDPTSGTTMETVEMLSELIDIWAPSAELLERLGPELVPEAKRVGKEVWFYDASGRSKTLSCLGLYRWRFWYAWNQGFTGAGWWCYAHHGDDLWLGPNSTGDFFATVYDGPDGPISSKRWEVAREGVEDYEYLWMLREAIEAAERDAVDENTLADARRLLADMPPRMERVLNACGRRLPLSADSVPLYDEAAAEIRRARAEIVRACLTLDAGSDGS
ncbi:MAG: PQQ-binding-like beta-propeller repeat protein [bacterium]|nr:PQQ-binding-like beta-propeller repeat protein [bacterium]